MTYINKRHKAEAWKPALISSNVIAIELQIAGRKFTINNIYESPGGTDMGQQDYDSVAQWSAAHVRAHPPPGVLLWVGDFNAHHPTWSADGENKPLGNCHYRSSNKPPALATRPIRRSDPHRPRQTAGYHTGPSMGR